MDILRVVLTSILSIVVIFAITKLKGAQQISELNMFDYINGISVGSIAAELATEIEKPVFPLCALIVYGAVGLLISIIERKSPKARRFLSGSPTVLMQGGKIVRPNFKKCKMDVNEFLERCRILGYYDMSEIELALLEPSGRLSVLPKEANRPTQVSDVTEPKKQASACVGVIYDGKVIKGNLKYTGRDEKWLEVQVRKQGCKVEDVFLATCDSEGMVNVFPTKNEKTNSFFAV